MLQSLQDFWAWAEITPEEYAKNGIDLLSEKAPFNYPNFDFLIEYCCESIQKDFLTDKEIDDILTIMALDNETQDVLDMLEKKLPQQFEQRLIHIGLKHLQHEARWQLAELIYRRQPEGYEKYLRILAKDEHAYVQKRAKNALSYLGLSLKE